MKRDKNGEHRTRRTRKEDRNKRKSIKNKERERRLQGDGKKGSAASVVYENWCRASKNKNNWFHPENKTR